MSVLIKGMEMPTSPVLFCIHPDGKVFADLEGGWREYKAAPVQPHGRLIDADELLKKIRCRSLDEHGEYLLWYVGEDDIKNAPTIIPAEEGE